MTVGFLLCFLMLGCRLLLGQDAPKPTDLAKAYSEGGVLAIFSAIIAALCGAIAILWRRMIVIEDAARALTEKHSDLLVRLVEKNTEALTRLKV